MMHIVLPGATLPCVGNALAILEYWRHLYRVYFLFPSAVELDLMRHRFKGV